MDPNVAEPLVVPLCFVLAGFLGLRLGTPAAVGLGLLWIGGAHLGGIGLAASTASIAGPTGALAHVVSQVLFVGGFVGFLWLVLVFPHGSPSRRSIRLTVSAGVLAAVGPLVGGLAGPTPAVVRPDGAAARRGPVVELLPPTFADLAAAPLAVIPAAALVVFLVRFARADRATRAVLAWPVVAVALVILLVVCGTALGDAFPAAGDIAFLSSAPLVPLSFAFGPLRRRLQRLSDDLAERVAELEESRRRIASATEAERQRIERDLHDGAQQEILALIAHVEIARSTQDAAERGRALERVAELSRGAYDRIRRIAHGVRPPELDDLGLSEAVRAIGETVPLRARLELDRTRPGQYPPAVEGAALLFVSEAVANVLKHAGASELVIRLVAGTDLRIDVRDDGVGGLDPRGRGIRGLCDRVEAVGGAVTIDSAPGATRLTATFAGAGSDG